MPAKKFVVLFVFDDAAIPGDATLHENDLNESYSVIYSFK